METIFLYLQTIGQKIHGLGAAFSRQPRWKQYVWLAFGLLIVILLNSQFLAKSGDMGHRWTMARVYAATGSFQTLPDHHLLRWAIVWPAIGLIKLLGDSFYVYYLYPMLCYVVGGLVFYALARKVLSPEWAPVAVLFYAFYPENIGEGTQFMPLLPATLWIMVTLLLTLRALESKHHALWYMIGAGLSLGIAYGCKETSFFWAPGIFLAMAFLPSQSKNIIQIKQFHITPGMLAFFGTCVIGLATETLILNHIYGCSLGRFELLQSTHLYGMSDSSKTANLLTYPFSPLRVLHWQGKYYSSIAKNLTLILALIGTFTVFVSCCNKRLKLLAAAFLGAFLCHSYIVFKFSPISYPEKPHHRYFIALITIGMLVFFAALPTIWQWLCKRTIWWRIAFAAANAVLLLMIIITDVNARMYEGTPFQMAKMDRILATALHDGSAVGVISGKKEISDAQNGMTYPGKWGILYLQTFGNVTDARDARIRPCTYERYGKSDWIIWLTPYQSGARCYLLEQTSIRETQWPPQ